MLWPTPVINFWNPILNRHCGLLFTLMISFDPLIVSRGVFSLTLKWCLTDINQSLFFKRPSEAKPKTSHAHVQSLGKNILLLSSKPKQLKPGNTEHVGFCSWCLFIPKSSNPQKSQIWITLLKCKLYHFLFFDSSKHLFESSSINLFTHQIHAEGWLICKHCVESKIDNLSPQAPLVNWQTTLITI